MMEMSSGTIGRAIVPDTGHPKAVQWKVIAERRDFPGDFSRVLLLSADLADHLGEFMFRRQFKQSRNTLMVEIMKAVAEFGF